jgi:hypothetical protein
MYIFKLVLIDADRRRGLPHPISFITAKVEEVKITMVIAVVEPTES